ncbi:hypothetical protein GCM10010339_73590 [Streptomyces alanosinicus]|uniref:Uncharacterized protein n=1 Tax=Streptomyces alanosinicus TaxID=68171 RepID=A0A918YR45_9ACTN|nr:hypothetical protein GCM10010339_73590 [Streptomyces alanosinicus]
MLNGVSYKLISHQDNIIHPALAGLSRKDVTDQAPGSLLRGCEAADVTGDVRQRGTVQAAMTAR